MDYDIFREELGKKYPAYGHALWEPDPGPGPDNSVQVGDVGFIHRGRFHRLFNALRPGDDPSQIFGVPEHYQQLEPNINPHIYPNTLRPNDFRSKEVTVESGGFGIHSSG
jgi:hypothetical protein